MRRVSLCVVFLALASSFVSVLIVRSWADEPSAPRPKPAAPPEPTTRTTNADDPFAATAAAPPAQTKSTAAAPTPSPTKPTGLASGNAAMLHSYDRILTPEMATAPEAKESFDALTSSECAAFAKINAALGSPTEIDCKETPLWEVVAQLKKRHKIEIQFDSAGLKDAGVDPDCPVTKHLSGITLRSALGLLLDDIQLKYAIHNEVLLITSLTKAQSDEFQLTRFYPVKDLVLVRNEHNEIQTDFQPLMDLIENLIATKSWTDNGGNGTISPYVYQDHCLLVVSQSQEVHEQITNLLASLRRFAGADTKDGRELRLPKYPPTVAPSLGWPLGGGFM